MSRLDWCLEAQRGFVPVSEEGLKLVPKMQELFHKKGYSLSDIYTNDEYKEPKRATYESAGSDIYYTGKEIIRLFAKDKVIIITNVKSYMKSGEMLLADVRGSQGLFADLMLCNTIGVIDKDYYNNENNEGNIAIALRNVGKNFITINPGDAIAQLIFVPFLAPDNEPEQKDRVSGFGHTSETPSISNELNKVGTVDANMLKGGN
jgi:dUTP pyrophosphatase